MLKATDFSKEYKPESKIVMDIPTALNFFLRAPDFTQKMVGEKIGRLVKEWNRTYGAKDSQEVGVTPYLFYILPLKK